MGQLKQVMTLDDLPMIRHVAAPFVAAGLQIVVVLGHEKERVQAALHDLTCEYINNPQPEIGMFSSIQLGCRAIARGEGCLLSTCDCPGILPGTIGAVRDALEGSPNKVIIPNFAGRRGHPAGLPAFLVKKIRALPQETPGLNSLWRERPDMLQHLEVDDSAILRDLDRPEDVEKFTILRKRSFDNVR